MIRISKITGKIAFFSVWLILMALTVSALYFEESYVPRGGKPIAKLSSKKGQVQVRPDSLALWVNSVENQAFFEGDSLATAGNSKALVKFTDGRVVELGPDSQIMLTALVDDQGSNYLVTLLRGNFVAKSEPKQTKPSEVKSTLTVKAGDTAYALMDKKDEITLSKTRGEEKATVDSQSGQIKKLATVDIFKQVLAAKKLEIPEKIEAKKPVLNIAGFEPSIKFPQNNTVYWVDSSFKDESSKLDFPAQLLPPSSRPEAGEWSPFIEVSDGINTAQNIIIDGESKFTEQIFKLPLSSMRNILSLNSDHFAAEYKIKIRTGARLAALNADPVQSYSQQTIEYSIRSLRDLPAKAVSLDFKRFQLGGQNRSAWFPQTRQINSEEAELSISLVSSDDVSRLLPLIRGNTEFNVGPSHANFENGVFAMRDSKIISEISSKSLNRDQLNQVRDLLGSSLIFKGNSGAYLGKGSDDYEALKKIMFNKNLQTRKFYILTNGKIEPVSRQLVASNRSVFKLVLGKAKAIFSEPVEILATK